ncbi:MAG: D,D-heptose 1,7-bisphosphate phosphatase [Denitrovibrio sp.]|nr:MAG: D,D-heptose 1,7-bisphosphate phosphatase [Denitrovibrio sp.]
MDKALFLDRDGIINIDKGYLYKPEDVEFVDGIFDLLKYAQDKGYQLFVITNQSGIAREKYTHEDVLKLHLWMKDKFTEYSIEIKDFFYCPHHPKFSEPCDCRKPEPGMIMQACEKYDIDLSRSVILGDKPSDVQAGKKAGLKMTILLSSQYINEKIPEADVFIANIKEAINFL